MEPLFLVLVYFLPLWLLLIGWICGSAAQRRHYRSMNLRYREHSHMLVTDLRTFPQALTRPGTKPPGLVVCQTVIATDYLKSFLANLRKIFGGEVRSYLQLVERARREALLRVLEEARQRGYNAVCNVRLETADIGGNMGNKGAAMVTLVASGTAYEADLEGRA
jgi:uncharacterized protein YbjQ (UPF0145 family)